MSKKIDEYLKYVYYSGRDLSKVYTILARLNGNDTNFEWLSTSLINEQIAIKNSFSSQKKGYIFPYESWIGLNVLADKHFEDFISDVREKSTKIYVSLDRTKVKEITDKIFKFLSDNNIECQGKIGKNLRTDALTIRVCKKEDVEKVINFINSMDYTPNVFPNPFLLNVGKVSVARDGGTTSYNQVLSHYIDEYYYYNMAYNENHNDWREVGCEGFVKFIEQNLSRIEKEKDPDLYMVTDLIYRNAKGTLKLEDILNYNNDKDKSNTYSYNKESNNSTDKSEEYKFLITKLSNYYDSNREYLIKEKKANFASGIDYAHAIIETYLMTGDIRIFTRNGSIRNLVQNNFDVYTMRETVNNVGWESIIQATQETIIKYNSTSNITGVANNKGVIEKIFRGENKIENGQNVFNLFTNNNNVRSRLGYLISPSIARNILISKLNIDPYNYNPSHNKLEEDMVKITNIVLEEASLSKKVTR